MLHFAEYFRGDSAALILLDLSAAFNTVDHPILLQRLQTTFGVHDVAHRWFQSSSVRPLPLLRLWSIKSAISSLICSMPQGSVLGPILFVLYTADLISLVDSHVLLRGRHSGVRLVRTGRCECLIITD